MQGKARRGKARRGKARQGEARQGEARRGDARPWYEVCILFDHVCMQVCRLEPSQTNVRFYDAMQGYSHPPASHLKHWSRQQNTPRGTRLQGPSASEEGAFIGSVSPDDRGGSEPAGGSERQSQLSPGPGTASSCSARSTARSHTLVPEKPFADILLLRVHLPASTCNPCDTDPVETFRYIYHSVHLSIVCSISVSSHLLIYTDSYQPSPAVCQSTHPSF